MKPAIVLSLGLLVGGCWDARRNNGKVHSVKCYSHGTEIYEGLTRGEVSAHSTFIEFHDIDTGRTVAVIGDCVVIELGGQ